MQMAAHCADLARDQRLALVWRLLSYLFLFLVVNLVTNVARAVLQSTAVPSVIGRLVFTLLYISGILGLTYVYRRFIDRRSWLGIALPPFHKRLLERQDYPYSLWELMVFDCHLRFLIASYRLWSVSVASLAAACTAPGNAGRAVKGVRGTSSTGSGTRCRLGLEQSHLNSGSFVYTDHYQRSEGGGDVIA